MNGKGPISVILQSSVIAQEMDTASKAESIRRADTFILLKARQGLYGSLRPLENQEKSSKRC